MPFIKLTDDKTGQPRHFGTSSIVKVSPAAHSNRGNAQICLTKTGAGVLGSALRPIAVRETPAEVEKLIREAI